jgi:hypothetical protein
MAASCQQMVAGASRERREHWRPSMMELLDRLSLKHRAEAAARGLAAAAVATAALEAGVEPRALAQDVGARRRIQDTLLRELHSPIYWYADVFADQPVLFRATQLVAVEGIMTGLPGTLEFQPATVVTRSVAAIVLQRLAGVAPKDDCQETRQPFSDVPCGSPYYRYVQALLEAGVLDSVTGGAFRPDEPITRRDFVVFLLAALGLPEASPPTPSYTDVLVGDSGYPAIEGAHLAGLLDDLASGSAFMPNAVVTRGDAAIASLNALRRRYGLP